MQVSFLTWLEEGRRVGTLSCLVGSLVAFFPQANKVSLPTLEPRVTLHTDGDPSPPCRVVFWIRHCRDGFTGFRAPLREW